MGFLRKLAFVSAVSFALTGTAAALPAAAADGITAAAVSMQGVSEDFLSTGFDAKDAAVHNGSTAASFNMNGRTYRQGITFDRAYGDAEISFNVENVNQISFTIGHLDDTDGNSASLLIYLDDAQYDSIPLTSNMELSDYDLDTSKASVVRIVLDRNGWSGYALGNVSVNGAGTEFPCTVPEYDSAASFMKSGFNVSDVNVTDTSASNPAFYMNGRGFYQGLTFDRAYGDSVISFNVESVEEISFTIGHLDNVDENSAKLCIYLDNGEYDTIDLTWNMELQDYTIDTTECDVLRIVLDRNGWSGYALANVSVDEYSSGKGYTVPEYESAADFIKRGFNVHDMTPVSTNAKNPAFYMNGRGFYQGIEFERAYGDSSVCFNVENVDEISFTIGHLDNVDENSAKLIMYLDNSVYDTVELTWNMELQEFTIDTTDSVVLNIVLDRNGWSGYALANVSVDDYQPEKGYTVPTYDSAASFIKSGFSVHDMTPTSTTAKNPAYYMNGRGFYQGIVFERAYGDSGVCYNVENVDEISFTVGHLDNSDENAAQLIIYLDNSVYDTLNLTWNMELTEYTIDTADSVVLRIVLDRNGWSGYALADVSVDSYQPDKTCIVPEYDSAEQFIKSGFGITDMTAVSTGASNPAFTMSGVGFYQGIVFERAYGDSKVCYNVENVDEVTFTIGHLDDVDGNKASLIIYLDNAEYDKIEMTEGMELLGYTINTADASVLRIVLDRNGWAGYALGNVEITVSEVQQPDPSEELELGDIDGDAEITATDAQLTLQAYLEMTFGNGGNLTPEQIAAADIDGDGTVTAADAQMILIYYLNNTVAKNPLTWDDIRNGRY